MPQLLGHLPAEYGTYYEPFLGGGSLFLHLSPASAVLGDALEPLVVVWNQVISDHEAVLRIAREWPLESETYYKVRALNPSSELERAAQFLYLNKGSFNGLWRVNRNGGFNVPWGAPKSDFIADDANLAAVARLARQSSGTVLCGDFEDLVSGASEGDLVFLDPPYVTAHNTNGFAHYNSKLFSWDDQKRLAHVADTLARRGVHVRVTNAAHASIAELYPSFLPIELSKHSTLAAAKAKRVRVTETLFVSKRSA